MNLKKREHNNTIEMATTTPITATENWRWNREEMNNRMATNTTPNSMCMA